MNETERLILECLQVLIGGGCDNLHKVKLCIKLEKALAPKSGEGGYEKDIEEPCKHEWEEFCVLGGCLDKTCDYRGRLCRKCRIDRKECSPSSKELPKVFIEDAANISKDGSKAIVDICKRHSSITNPRHENMCGVPIKDKEGIIVINCGDDLGGDNNEFTQCKECRIKDYESSPSSKDGGLE